MVDWRYILSMSIWQKGKYDEILFVDLQIKILGRGGVHNVNFLVKPVYVYSLDAISDA